MLASRSRLNDAALETINGLGRGDTFLLVLLSVRYFNTQTFN